jgi:hypothetical protein
VRFLCKIEDGYPGPDVNPYHCKTHAADVVRSLYVILTKGGVLRALWPDKKEGTGRLSQGGANEGGNNPDGQGSPIPAPITISAGARTGHLGQSHMARGSHEGRLRLSDIHDLPLLSAIIAAVIHDFEHKGFNVRDSLLPCLY